MWPRAAAFLFTVVLGTFVCLEPAAAQDDDQKSSPLSVAAQFSTVLDADCNSAKGMVVQLHYTGAQPLRGYLVRLVLRDSSTGKVLTEQIIQEIRDLREHMIVNGAEWTRTLCSIVKTTAGAPLTVTAKVDVLRFTDGSIWGPASLPVSHQLIGTMDGMDFSRKTTDLERYVSPILPPGGPVPLERVEFKTIGPLRFMSGVWRDEGGQQMLAVEATNIGATPIRGYVFTASFFDPATGNRLRRVTTKQLETHGNPNDYLLPGATWVAGARKFSYLPDGTLASYAITLDLVVFDDGSMFGPKQSSESDEVLGMFQGIDGANPSSKGTFRAKKPQ
jgi:hypothetical protein